jgi:micrococcal nuclease
VATFSKHAQRAAKIKLLKFVHSAIPFLQVNKNYSILPDVLINLIKNTAKNNLSYLLGILHTIKASKWTPFVFLTLVFFAPAIYANNCTVNQFDETVQVAHVYDGDTIKLTDGRKLRLIGINTPERGRDGKKNEPFYQAAKNQLQKIIKKNASSIKIIFGKAKRDRYKRLLVHIFTLDNENITATLLKKGLGFTITIPPNIQLLSCYQKAEREAQKQKRGIWNHPYSKAIDVNLLKKSARGFHRITGTVQRVGENRSSFWLNLNTKSEAKFALRILKKDLPYFTQFHPEDLINHQLIARGWIYQTKNEQRMTIHHPASLQILNTD